MESMAEGMIKDLVASGHALADDMTGAPSVLVRCLAAQLEVQLVRANALAAENAALKKFCKDAAFDADYEAELGMERGGFSDALNDIETTATDAFLAEVRAQGVEMFADHLLCPNLDDTIRDFAAQLRKGVQS
ncbi:hypothetical protein GTE47_003098 [Salmonella enterica subsp. enterica]|nr:hypothetical protein [Salmonella enterica]EDR5341300.1 hypothetical protein [Salmonella enterica subsp. enterica]EDQ1687650.1 hypothetical protein [Salmonella enterica]EDZ4105772.1 hypothetical protein [Salmonella enterica]EEN5760235.1 hypothetical protein [Salmonella enterica]